MGLSRSLHAVIAIAIAACGNASGAPGQKATKAGSGSAVVKPAGSSTVESSDVPAYQTSPARFAVTPFVNNSNARAMDWLVTGAPFEIAEKTEDVLGLEPTGGTLRVEPKMIDPEPDPVAAFGVERNAQWVVTGWVDRYQWNLRIAVTLWKVTFGKSPTAVVVAEVQRTGDPKDYHRMMGELIGAMWTKGAGVQIDIDRAARLGRPFAIDVYAVNLMSRGLGEMIGVYGPVNLKAAEKDMEKAVLIDPKCPEAQRLLGELYSVLATTDPKQGGDPRYAGKAATKFAYANDLAPDNIGALHNAATAATRAGKHEVARDILKKLVTRKPWEIDARYEYGAELWHTGDVLGAERQLEQVTAKNPDYLPARRVLVLIHASRGDTSKLVTELEAIAARAPSDLEVKADLATAYGSINRWDRATAQLELIAAARPTDVPLFVRIGDSHRRMNDLDGALQWYARAQRLAPETSMPGFMIAQSLFDAGKIPEAIRQYTNLQKYPADTATAEHALGALAFLQGRWSDAAWYMRRAVKGSPRLVSGWRTMIAAELARKDFELALRQLDRALPMWPGDGQLLYLAGVAYAYADEKGTARKRFTEALVVEPTLASARAALSQLDAGGQVSLVYTPELVRPWGDANAIVDALGRYDRLQQQMADSRAAYQQSFLKLLAVFGKGPLSPQKQPAVRQCPVGHVATDWASAQKELRHYERLGSELETQYRFIARHDELGATGALLPNARAHVEQVKKSYRTALADIGELRAEWARGLGPELRFAGCYDKLLAAAAADPDRYRVIVEDKPDPIPQTLPPRPKPRATFYIDNTRCPDAVDVWIDGIQLGQVAPGRRSALVSDAGERSLCLIVPGSAQCGDRGTTRQVYLHDGWTATLHCPK